MYMQEVRVERIAAQMNLDRRYLSRIFKEKTGKSIQEYLISDRIEEAKRCLSRGLTVSEAAILSGYEDVCNFSKMFKSRVGVSPSSYAAKNSNERENFLEMSKKV
jgi:AraC-like DNA-binding protein